MEKKGIGIVLFLFCFSVFSCVEQRILEMAELEKIDHIAGLLRGEIPKGQEIYENIRAKYSSDIIEKEYFKTNSSIAKIHLYLILRERDWNNLPLIYEDLLKRGSDEIIYIYGCFVDSIQLCEIIKGNYNGLYFKLNDEKQSEFVSPEID